MLLFKPRFAYLIAALCLASAVVSACGFSDSKTQDIFREDQNLERRHPATSDEILWTIDMKSCTGHLLAPDIMMTAAHCNPNVGDSYTSGSAMLRRISNDIRVTQILEYNPSMDFAILNINWTSGKAPSDQKFPPLVAVSPKDVSFKQIQTSGDELFTVGFPADQRRATYSQGTIQNVSGNLMLYDMGIINGNSGGGAWLKKNNMLVSLTNGGPNALGGAGWNTGSINDSNHWNHGIAMFQAYAASSTLRRIFPDGKNIYGGTTVEGSSNGSINLNVALEPQKSGNFALFVASDKNVKKVVTCELLADACIQGATGYRQAKFVKSANDISFYNATTDLQIKNNMIVGILAFDESGKIINRRSVRLLQKDVNNITK